MPESPDRPEAPSARAVAVARWQPRAPSGRFDGRGSVLAVTGSYLLLTSIEGHVVQPIAVGRRLAVNPLVVIIALLRWDWLWGVAGFALTLPLVLALKAVCTHVAGLQPVAEAMSPAPRWTPRPWRRPTARPPPQDRRLDTGDRTSA